MDGTVTRNSAPVLFHRKSFGINCRFRHNIEWFEDEESKQSIFIFAAGRKVVFHDEKTGQQRFLLGSEPSHDEWMTDNEICGLTLSPQLSDQTRFLAVSERGEMPRVSIWDARTLQLKSTLDMPDSVRSKEIVSVGCSDDCTLLFVQCGSPDWQLVVYSLNTAKFDLKPLHFFARDDPNSSSSSNNNNNNNNQNNGDDSQSDDDVDDDDEDYDDLDGVVLDLCSEGGGDLLLVCNQHSLHLRSRQTDFEIERVDVYPYDRDEHWTGVCWLNPGRFVAANQTDVLLFEDGKYRHCLLTTSSTVTCMRLSNDRRCLVIGCYDGSVSVIETESWSMIGKLQLGPDAVAANATANNNSANDLTSSSMDGPQSPMSNANGGAGGGGSSSSGMMKSNNNNHSGSTNGGSSSDQPSEQWVPITISSGMHVATQNQQIFRVQRDLVDDSVLRLTQPLGSFHSGGITALHCCVRKPLCVTCDSHSISVWNYRRQRLELSRSFEQPVLSVSFHPSGLHLLVGFADKLKLFNVMRDELMAFKDFHIIRNCQLCEFSNGGHYFAAVNSADKIHVHNTYTGELLAILRGHNQSITSLRWAKDDGTLVSTGREGAAYQWRIASPHAFTRAQEFVNRQVPLHSAVLTKEKLYVSGHTPNTIYEVSDSQLEKEFHFRSEGSLFSCEMTSLTLGQRRSALFAATDKGLLRSMVFPLQSDIGAVDSVAHGAPVLDYPAHLGAVSKVRVTIDGRWLLSTGVDGVLNMFEIGEREGRETNGSSNNKNSANNQSSNGMSSDRMMMGLGTAVDSSEEVMVSLGYLFGKEKTREELKSRAEELKLQNEYKVRLKEMKYSDRAREREESWKKEVELCQTSKEVLRQQISEMELEFEEQMKSLESDSKEQLSEIEKEYQNRVMKEMDKYQTLEETLKKEQKDWEQWTLQRQSEFVNKLESCHNEGQSILCDLQLRYDDWMKKKHICDKEYKETIKQLEEDFDGEIENLKEKNQSILSEERESTLRLKGENGVMLKKFASLKNEIDELTQEQRKMSNTEQQLKLKIDRLKQQILLLDQQLLKKDSIINEKEKHIYSLKKHNQSLEKHRFVLDFKIKDIKKQIEPKQSKILSMEQCVNEMEQQLKQLKEIESDLEQDILDCEDQTRLTQLDLNNLRKCKNTTMNDALRFLHDLHVLIENMHKTDENDAQSLKLLFDGFEQAHHSSLSEEEDSEVSAQLKKEYARQIQHLQSCADALRAKINAKSKQCYQSRQELVQKNVQCMEEIKVLKQQLDSLTGQSVF